MYKVNIKNACSCFVKSGMAESQEFENENDAQQEGTKLLAQMQAKFCKKHDFKLVEQFGDSTIYIKARS